jgi:LysR family glycine cleavage system transcriptional activator
MMERTAIGSRVRIVATRRDSTSVPDRVDKTLHVKTLFEETLIPVCSPDFLKIQGQPREPADLHGWPLLYDLHWTTYWSHWFAHHGAGEADLSQASGFRLYSMMVQAAVEGMGVALGHSLMIARELEQGTLVSLFDARVTAPARYLLVTAPGSAKKPQVRAFRNWILNQAEARSANEKREPER